MIRAHNPLIFPFHPPDDEAFSRSVTVEFGNGDKLVSLHLDNSNGMMEMLGRGDIRVFRGKEDVTHQVFGAEFEEQPVHSSLENFDTAMNWLRRSQWGFAS